MAKRKGKKAKKSLLGLVLALVILLCGVLSIALFLSLDAVTLNVGDKALEDFSYQGMKVAFGYTEEASIIKATILNASVPIIIALVLVVAGAVLGLFKGRIINLVSALLLIVAAVLFIMAGPLTGLTEEVRKLIGLVPSSIEIGYKAAIGAYLGCAFAAVAGLTALVKGLLKK